jgi:hypothetical protein
MYNSSNNTIFRLFYIYVKPACLVLVVIQGKLATIVDESESMLEHVAKLVQTLGFQHSSCLQVVKIVYFKVLIYT